MRSSLPPATWVEPVLWIPEAVWQGLLENFDRAPEGVERVAFLDGVPVPPGPGGVVTTLTVPAAALSPGNYRIGAAEMSAAGKHLRHHRLQRLAQVHTHGDTCTIHSPTDDAMVLTVALFDDGAAAGLDDEEGLKAPRQDVPGGAFVVMVAA